MLTLNNINQEIPLPLKQGETNSPFLRGLGGI